jgi:predicted phage baseplate assembly protein
MPLPIPTLDDRRFDDLVQEAVARLEAHTPEYSNVAPGDPGAALIDLFAWLTETILYRQNLIPLRQRRAFMNLLAIPLQPAVPAGGLVCVDATQLPLQPPFAAGELKFTAGPVSFTTTTDLQPTPLQLVPMIKAQYLEADPVIYSKVLTMLGTLYNIDQPTPFIAQPAFGADGTLSLASSIDGLVWLALLTPKNYKGDAASVRAALAGITLSIGLAPVEDIPGFQAFDQATDLPPQTLSWAVVNQNGQQAPITSTPLEVLADTSNGARTRGVSLLRLPSNAALLTPPNAVDPMFAGMNGGPPELPAGTDPATVVMWLTVTTADAPALKLAYLAVNAVDVIARVLEHDEPLGTATGQGDATFQLKGAPVDASSLVIQVWQGSLPVTWSAVDNFGRAGPNDTVYVLDATAGTVTFGDGIRGLRPPNGAVIVAQGYAWGGGSDGNLAAGSITAVAPNTAGTVRHDRPTSGGSDGESVADAERRIPAFLANRDRAVTIADFQSLALATPGLSLGRADVVWGLMPGAEAASTRENVPGVVSVFVFPNGPLVMGAGPVATLAQLKDVFAFLRQRILIGTQLFVLGAEPVPVYACVSIKLQHGADPVAVTRQVQQALLSYLWPLPPGGPDGGGWPLGRTVASDELLTQAARVSGVLAVDGLVVYGLSESNWTASPSSSANSTSVALSDWQVANLQGVSVATDGSPPSPPDGSGAAGPGQLVPYVPDVC